MNVHLRNNNITTILNQWRFTLVLLLSFLMINEAKAHLPYPSKQRTGKYQTSGTVVLTLSNERIACSVVIDSGRIVRDDLITQPAWAKQYGAKPVAVGTDADFALDVMYTDWQAPGKANNADNPILLTKKDFKVVRDTLLTLDGGTKELILDCKGKETPFIVRVTYRLEPDAFYIRRNIAVMDTSFGHHFLRWFWPRRGTVSGVVSVVKAGDFGQPVAVLLKSGGAFFGLEYPTAENRLKSEGKGSYQLQCGQEFGERIGKAWLPSEWVVEAITPNSYVKDWFFKYVDSIRVAPLRPYTLYNSWYDLRSPEYPKVPRENFMGEESAMKMIRLLRDNMIEKHAIKLDAFVLDDGWDVYESDWVLRKQQFPNGLKPLAEELKKTDTHLGIWFGPIGGYSFRRRRIAWMKEHGYEVVGDQFCVAGKNYGALIKKRVNDFVQNDGVGYYKWDGIQFSCSEPDHGHPTDIYSRRAVMETVKDWCVSVREKDPEMFLNITSGTWLSPWWVKYANTIWMQGEDYGYSDVPSISQRDAAITYRDFVLYDDFKNLDLWFPIANLMTHGIIKGKLELLGSPEEPLDKFTDDALLYCARGVSMYELYISPDILSEGEWNTLAASLTWARDRFPILSTTYMVGGNPLKRESYGYVHFKGKRAILAARNPFITTGKLDVELAVARGLDPTASSLVVEKVYPTRWISPRLFKANDHLNIPLGGYETAIYEVYPVDEATVPLVAGVPFDVAKSDHDTYVLSVYGATDNAKILNPKKVIGRASLHGLVKKTVRQPEPLDKKSLSFTSSSSGIFLGCTIDESVRDAMLSILLTPSKKSSSKKLPQVRITLDGKEDTAKFEQGEGAGLSTWYTLKVSTGKHRVELRAVSREQSHSWSGHASVWLVCQQQQEEIELTLRTTKKAEERPMPPRPLPPGVVPRNVKLGEADIVGLQ